MKKDFLEIINSLSFNGDNINTNFKRVPHLLPFPTKDIYTNSREVLNLFYPNKVRFLYINNS